MIRHLLLNDQRHRTDMRRPSAIKREADFRAVVGACVGNVLEYFDFSLFGYFADVIGKVFFGTEDEHESLMMSFSVFAIAFVVRPIGGILLGMLGDVAGRVTALRLSIALMAIPTFLLGLLPPYATIGIFFSCSPPTCFIILYRYKPVHR